MQKIDLTGQKFGKLTVINEHGGRKYRQRLWYCKCDCGGEKIVMQTNLKQKTVTSCGCLIAKYKSDHHSWGGYEDISLSYFNRLKYTAEKRNIDFKITIKDMWDLFIKQNKKCALSGIELFFGDLHSSKYTASLDRINPNLGYIIGNIQWIHKKINIVKNKLDQNDFLNMCTKISEYQKTLSLPLEINDNWQKQDFGWRPGKVTKNRTSWNKGTKGKNIKTKQDLIID